MLKAQALIRKIFIYERDDFVAEQKKSFFDGLRKYRQFICAIKKENIDCAID
jgi:hypothetical protein